MKWLLGVYTSASTAAEKVRPNHYGVDRQETDAQKAAALVQKELHRRDWAEADLSLRPRGDRAKVAMARRLRNESTMTFKNGSPIACT